MHRLTHYEDTMAEIGPYRPVMRQYVNRALFDGDLERNIWKVMREVRQRRHLNRLQSEDAFHALLTEMFSYVYGKNEFPIRRNFHENSESFEKIAKWLIKSNDMMASVNTQHFLNHERGGKRVYEISQGLTDMLYNTELRGLQIEHLNLPFPSLYLMIPAECDMKMYTRKHGGGNAVGIYVAIDPSGVWSEPGSDMVLKKSFSGTMVMQALDGVDYDERELCHTWNIMVVGESLPDSDSKMNCPLFNAVLRFKKGLSLDEVIEDLQQRYSTGIVPRMRDQWPNIVRFVFNAIIYATNNELDAELSEANPEAAKLWEKASKMPESRKRKNVEDQAQRLSYARTVLGSKIVIDRSRFPSSPGTGAGTPQNVRVLVCGHWRKVAHGPGKTERRLTWIKPFWRGPELGEVSQRRHKLDRVSEE